MATSWKKGPWREKVVRVEPTHKVPSTNFEGKKYPKRWVVWLVTNENERVWVRTVKDDSDFLLLRLRSLLVKEFFGQLVGQEIVFDKYHDEAYQECYSVNEDKLPENLLLDKFTRIYAWCEKNHPEWLENDLELLRKKRNRAVAAAKKRNTDMLAERRRNALKLTFVEGRNPKWGDKQWQARHNGRLFVLARECEYNLSEGSIPIKKVLELVPDKVILVARI